MNTIFEKCYTWAKLNIPWADVNWLWDMCLKIAANVKCYIWDELNLKWIEVDWTWSECQLLKEFIEEITGGGGALDPGNVYPYDDSLAQEWARKNAEKKKKLIRIICKVKGYLPNEIEKEVKKNRNITIRDIQLLMKVAKSVDLTVTPIHKTPTKILH